MAEGNAIESKDLYDQEKNDATRRDTSAIEKLNSFLERADKIEIFRSATDEFVEASRAAVIRLRECSSFLKETVKAAEELVDDCQKEIACVQSKTDPNLIPFVNDNNESSSFSFSEKGEDPDSREILVPKSKKTPNISSQHYNGLFKCISSFPWSLVSFISTALTLIIGVIFLFVNLMDIEIVKTNIIFTSFLSLAAVFLCLSICLCIIERNRKSRPPGEEYLQLNEMDAKRNLLTDIKTQKELDSIFESAL